MKIAQLLLEPASAYSRKAQARDLVLVSDAHSVESWTERSDRFCGPGDARLDTSSFRARLTSNSFDLLHIYGRPGFARQLVRGLPIPFVAPGASAPGRFPWNGRERPAMEDSPVATAGVPEAVSESFLRDPGEGEASIEHPPTGYLLGTFDGGRSGVKALCTETFERLGRFRSDIDWHLFDEPPSAVDLDLVDLWIDPAVEDDDFDGYLAEALVRDRPAIASRTPVNMIRFGGGDRGLTVRPGDPNELTHAIATALFKPETVEHRRMDREQARSRFDGSLRRATLFEFYERVSR